MTMADTAARSIRRPWRRSGRETPRIRSADRLPFARAASVIAVVVLAGALFGYDQGVISGALLGIQKAFAVGAVRARDRDELGHARRDVRIARRRLRRRPLRPQARAARRGGAFHHRRLGRGAFAPDVPVLVARPPGGRLRRRRRRGGGPALCGGARAGRAAGAVRLVLSARDHDRHLHRLSRRRGARGPGRLARDARGFRSRRGSARARRSDGCRVPALVRQGRPARRRAPHPGCPGRRRRGGRAARGDRGVAARRARNAVVDGRVFLALADAAENRPRPRGPAADHRHQRDHLLLGSNLRRGWIHDAGGADRGHHLGDRGRQRALDVYRDRLHRSPRPPPAPDRGPDRHGAQPGRRGVRLPAVPEPADTCRSASSRSARSSSSSSRSPSRSAR